MSITVPLFRGLSTLGPQSSFADVEQKLTRVADLLDQGMLPVAKKGSLEFHEFGLWTGLKHWVFKICRREGYRDIDVRAVLEDYLTLHARHLAAMRTPTTGFFERRAIRVLPAETLNRITAAYARKQAEKNNPPGPQSLRSLALPLALQQDPRFASLVLPTPPRLTPIVHQPHDTHVTNLSTAQSLNSLNAQNREILLPSLFDVATRAFGKTELYLPLQHFNTHCALASPTTQKAWETHLQKELAADPANPYVRVALAFHHIYTDTATYENTIGLFNLLPTSPDAQNAEVALLLSKCYGLGLSPLSPEENCVQERHWMQIATQRGHPAACFIWGKRRPDASARTFIEKAARQGIPHAMEQLMLLDQSLTKEAARRRWQELQEMVKADNSPLTQLLIGNCLLHGIGTTTDIPAALTAWTDAANRGNRFAQTCLPLYIWQLPERSILNRVPNLPTDKQCLNWLLQAAEQGVTRAQIALAQYYAGVGNAITRQLGLIPCALNLLGKADAAKACEWYRRLLLNGLENNKSAQEYLKKHFTV